MSNQNHIIKKTSFEVKTPPSKQDLDRLSIYFKNRVLPALEKALYQHFGSEQYIKLNKLEIDLGKIDLEHSSGLDHQIIRQIRDQLPNLLSADQQPTNASSKSVLDTFIHYLTFGFFPWWENEINSIPNLEEKMLDWLEIKSDPSKKKINLNPPFEAGDERLYAVRQLLQNNPTAQKRFTIQFSKSFIDQLQKKASLKENKISNKNLIKKNTARDQTYENQYFRPEKPSLKEISKQGPKKEIINPIQSIIHNQQNDKVTPQSDTSTSLSDLSYLQSEGITVFHAGIILLHPFLTRYFNILNLTQNKTFIHSEAQEFAAYTLNYLATGQTDLEEQNSILFKHLVGLDWTTPLQKSYGNGPFLTNEFQDQSDELLKAVLSNWNKLKNTSIDGLRSGFINRKGILRKHSNGFRLQVEQHSIDLLLEYLPWNISIIKLPWMQEVLYVDWG